MQDGHLTEAEIRGRQDISNTWVTSRTVFSDTTPIANKKKTRYHIQVNLNGNGGTSVVKIERLENDGITYTVLEDSIQITANARVTLPETFNLKNVYFEQPGGTKLVASASGNSISLTDIFWDNEIA